MSLMTDSPIRGCWFESWGVYPPEPYAFTPDKIPVDLCTHIFYAFATIDIVTFKAVSVDQWADVGRHGFDKTASLKLKNDKLRIILSFGGHVISDTGIFERMAAEKEKRKLFIDSAMNLLDKIGFDGIDISWIYPTSANKHLFMALMKELKDESRKRRKLVTASVAATAIIHDVYDNEKFESYVDYINLLTYDYVGAWESTSTITHMASFSETRMAIHRWESMDFPKDKMLLGIAAYGRGWTTKDCPSLPTKMAPAQKITNKEGFAAYYELDKMRSEKIPSADGSFLKAIFKGQQVCYSFDDSESIKKKMKEIVRGSGLGGAFVYALGHENDSFDVLRTMNRWLTGRDATATPTGPNMGDLLRGSERNDNGTSEIFLQEAGWTKPACAPAGMRFPDYADRFHYYQCSISGRWSRRHCPEGTAFDQENRIFVTV